MQSDTSLLQRHFVLHYYTQKWFHLSTRRKGLTGNGAWPFTKHYLLSRIVILTEENGDIDSAGTMSIYRAFGVIPAIFALLSILSCIMLFYYYYAFGDFYVIRTLPKSTIDVDSCNFIAISAGNAVYSTFYYISLVFAVVIFSNTLLSIFINIPYFIGSTALIGIFTWPIYNLLYSDTVFIPSHLIKTSCSNEYMSFAYVIPALLYAFCLYVACGILNLTITLLKKKVYGRNG